MVCAKVGVMDATDPVIKAAAEAWERTNAALLATKALIPILEAQADAAWKALAEADCMRVYGQPTWPDKVREAALARVGAQ